MTTQTAAGSQPAAGALLACALKIKGVALTPIDHQSQRVMTLAMIDQVHQRPDGTARRNFNEHKNRLIEGEDYFVRNSSEARDMGVIAPNGLVLLTETGYSMIVKAFTDDLAWHVQRQLVKSYFTKPASLFDPMASLSPEHRALVALLFESSAIKAEQAAQAAALAVQADAIKRIECNQIAAVASVQSFTAMGYSNYRDLQLSKLELTRLGRKAAAISKKRGITIDQVGDSRYGHVNSYHITMLDEALEAISK
ncbi:MAG TPA: ORF6N domain-containing protein [Telluria sp.]|jgi:hypothetical protein